MKACMACNSNSRADVPGGPFSLPGCLGSAGILRRLDLAAQDLPGRALRQLVDQPDLPRVLVSGDLVAGERAQFLRGRTGVRLQRHGRADLLAEVVVLE